MTPRIEPMKPTAKTQGIVILRAFSNVPFALAFSFSAVLVLPPKNAK